MCAEGQEEEGDVEKDMERGRGRNQAEAITRREADVWRRKTSEAGPLKMTEEDDVMSDHDV